MNNVVKICKYAQRQLHFLTCSSSSYQLHSITLPIDFNDFTNILVFKQVTKGQLWPKYSNYSKLRMENILMSLQRASGFKVRGLWAISPGGRQLTNGVNHPFSCNHFPFGKSGRAGCYLYHH